MKFITEYPLWFEFTKRLPRGVPRYRVEKSKVGLEWAAGLAQATPEQLATLAQAQFGPTYYNPAQYQPYGWPFSPWMDLFR